MVQVGKDNLAEKYSIPEDINWLVLEPENLAEKVAQLNSEEKKRRRRLGFNMVLVTDMDEETDLMALDNFVAAHTVFYASTVESYTEDQEQFFKKKLAKSILPENMDEFMSNLEFKFFGGQYGDNAAVKPHRYMINPGYKGEYKIEGQKYLILDDDFGDEDYAIGVKKGNTELKDKINEGLKKCNEDGTSAKISEKWFGSDIVVK